MLDVEGLEARNVSVSGGRAKVETLNGDLACGRLPSPDRPGRAGRARHGAARPLGLMMRGRLRIRGKRRRALRLRHMAGGEV